VIAEKEDIFGDGVNVAARLEALAEPGGICVSRVVRDQVRDRLDYTFEDLGEQQVKNIARPVRVYRVRDRAAPIERPLPATPQPLPLPDKPSIAVLPFQNMSGDPEQEYFADGMVEEITTALSKIRWFVVIARNSSFTYKGRTADVKQVGREFGVRYVIEGSVRKSGNRVRIAAQLIDTASGNHVWAERYDREIADIFAVQDEITERVVAAIEPELYAAENFHSRRKPPGSLDAWECVIRALSYSSQGTRAGMAEAEALCRRAQLQPSPQSARLGGNTPHLLVGRCQNRAGGGNHRGADSARSRRAGSLGAVDARRGAVADAPPRRSGAIVSPGTGVQSELCTGACLPWSAARRRGRTPGSPG
jgi:adenylate cyclase